MHKDKRRKSFCHDFDLPTIFDVLVWTVSVTRGLKLLTISSKNTAAREFNADDSVLKKGKKELNTKSINQRYCIQVSWLNPIYQFMWWTVIQIKTKMKLQIMWITSIVINKN